jgi:hypothetical protein
MPTKESIQVRNPKQMQLKIDTLYFSVSAVATQRPQDDAHTRIVSGQRLGKHVPVAKQQILNNVTTELQQLLSCVFYVVGPEIL